MADNINPQSKNAGYQSIPWGALQHSTAKARKKLDNMNPDTNWGLGVAKVININYVELFVTLRTLTGVSQIFDRVPVPLTFPGAGARHFFGALPEIGDTCVVGWIPEESSDANGTRTPVVLAWLIPGVWPGLDWVTVAEFDPDEYDTNNPKDEQYLKGVFSRTRHKLRHMQPGNIVASSSQGSDLVLDEGVTLANRRGNEFRLRDQDQAMVFRSLQQFHAMSGTRIYAGMVQRDARLLPAMTVSDGYEWDHKDQAIAGAPIPSDSLPPDSQGTDGYYQPAKLFQRRQLSGEQGDIAGQPFTMSSYIDPYQFLQRGGFLDDAGYVQDINQISAVSGAVYGGKPFFRVANQGKQNTVLETNTPTLTEYRIEVTHTADGRLPVTEQTDMFDAERLPSGLPSVPDSTSSNAPFIEWVLGSVVGNDPYTAKGQQMYGLPVVPVVFNGNAPDPHLEAAKIMSVGEGGNPTPLKDQAAMLFRMMPPTPEATAPTFWAVNKQGQFRGYVGGDAKEDSVHFFAQGNIRIGTSGKLELLLGGGMHYVALGKASLDMSAPEGAVTIYGGGPIKTAEATVERISGTAGGEGDLPAVDIQAKTNIRVKAEKKIFLKSNEHETNATMVNIIGHEGISMNGTKQVGITTDNYQLTCSAQASESFSGPKYMLPTNFPLHDRMYISKFPGFVGEKVTYVMCDRQEMFLLPGNHTTMLTIGNMTYMTTLGTWTASAVPNSMVVSSAGGVIGMAAAGVVAMTAAAGPATITGCASASLIATGGVGMVRGSAGVVLGAPITGPDVGPILCAGTLEPFTNLPFGTWGLGAKMHNVSA